MNDYEKQLRDAFDGVHAPQDLQKRTLEAIEAKRVQLAREEIEQKPINQKTSAGETLASEVPVQEGTSNSGTVDRPSFVPVPSSSKEKQHVSAVYKQRKRTIFSSLRMRAAVAACMVLVVIGICAGAYTYMTPTAYVGIDVNPSIELGVNRFDYVVSAEGLNDDGRAVLDNISVTGVSYDQAVQAIDKALQEDGYLSNDASVAVTVACDDEGQCQGLETKSQQCFGSAGGGVHCSRASSDEHHAAHDAGLGMGKYRVWQLLQNAGVNISAEEASGMTMSELLDLAYQEGIDIDSIGMSFQEHHSEDHQGQGAGSSASGQGGAQGNGQGNGGSGQVSSQSESNQNNANRGSQGEGHEGQGGHGYEQDTDRGHNGSAHE